MYSKKAMKIPPFYVMEILERAKELERSGMDIIHLEIGEPDFPTAPHICEAASSALKNGETKYTHSLGLPELRKAVADSYNCRFGLDVNPDQVIISSGTSPALLLLFMFLLDEGREVVMSNPYYACYPNFVEYMGGRPVYVYTREAEGFSIDMEELASKINPKTSAVIINSPSNPTGHVIRPGSLRELSELAGNVPVISDEIYQGLIYEGRDSTMLEFTDNAFVLNGFSKRYAMTGWRLGYLIAPQQYIRPLQNIQQNFFICANSFVQHAGMAALEGPQDHVEHMVRTYDERRRYIIKRLKEIGFGVGSEPTGAYYVLANARRFSNDSLQFCCTLLEKTGVAVAPGIDFGDGAQGYIRFSYANSIENIRTGLDRIEKYLNM